MNDSIKENVYLSCHAKAREHEMLYHYTSFESLLSIISSKQFRLTHIAFLNDPVEYERLSHDPFIQNKIYAGCFNHIAEDTIPLWKMYADGAYGIRIGFPGSSVPFFEDKLCYKFGIIDNALSLLDDKLHINWKVNDASLLDVSYQDDVNDESENSDELTVQPDNYATGFSKRKCWEFEQETRIRVGLQPVGELGAWVDKKTTLFKYATSPYRYIYFQIPDSVLLDMRIMFSPKSNDQLVAMMKNEIKRLLQDYKDESFQRSSIRIR